MKGTLMLLLGIFLCGSAFGQVGAPQTEYLEPYCNGADTSVIYRYYKSRNGTLQFVDWRDTSMATIAAPDLSLYLPCNLSAGVQDTIKFMLDQALIDSIQYDEPMSVQVATYSMSGSVGPGVVPSAITQDGDAITVGDSIVVPAGYLSICWSFEQGTSDDPGDGSIAELRINGLSYFPGTGAEYQTKGKCYSGGAFSRPIEVVVDGAISLTLDVVTRQ